MNVMPKQISEFSSPQIQRIPIGFTAKTELALRLLFDEKLF
jgi:hypothetical protein